MTSRLPTFMASLGYAQASIWASIPIIQLGWQGTFEGWASDPIHNTAQAHAIRDAQFGQSGVQAFGLSVFSIR